jgi:hypothetical protein
MISAFSSSGATYVTADDKPDKGEPEALESKDNLTTEIKEVDKLEDQAKIMDKKPKAVKFAEKTTEFKESVVQASTIKPEKHQKLSIEQQQLETAAEVDVDFINEANAAIDIVATTSAEQLQQSKIVQSLEEPVEPVLRKESIPTVMASVDEVTIIEQKQLIPDINLPSKEEQGHEVTIVEEKQVIQDISTKDEPAAPEAKADSKLAEPVLMGESVIVEQKQIIPEIDLKEIHKENETKIEVITEKTDTLQEQIAVEAIEKVSVQEVLS